METAKQRMEHSKVMCDTWAEIFRVEEDLAHSFPGALDSLYSHFYDSGTVDEAGEEADVCLLFHQHSRFTADNGTLFVEFKYDTLKWDPEAKEWVTEDGEPYFRE